MGGMWMEISLCIFGLQGASVIGYSVVHGYRGACGWDGDLFYAIPAIAKHLVSIFCSSELCVWMLIFLTSMITPKAFRHV